MLPKVDARPKVFFVCFCLVFFSTMRLFFRKFSDSIKGYPSSKRVSRSGGGVEDPPCFKIGYSRSARAESREGSSTAGFA